MVEDHSGFKLLGNIEANNNNITGIGDLSCANLDVTGLTSGSVLFSDGTSVTQDNANFFWNNTSKSLGLGTSTPTHLLDIKSSGAGTTFAQFIAANGRRKEN